MNGMLPITRSDVEAIIARVSGSECNQILCYKLEPFTTDKCGILGEHFLLSVTLKNQEDSIKFFVKSIGDINNLPAYLDTYIFEEEVNFYSHIRPLMLKYYNGEKWSADCYLAKNNTLVLEDLREHGFTMRFEQTMDESSLKSAITTLARFHACSVIAERKIKRPLNKAFPKYFSEKICNDDNKFGQITKLGYETQMLMAQALNLDASFVFPGVYSYVSQMVRPKKKELNVICHSDLFKYNILFNAADRAIILDYQLLRYASPVIDISILLYLNTTSEFRKSSENKILEHYYSIFRDTLRQHKVTNGIPSYESMRKKYDKCKIVGMATSVDYLASLYLEPKLRFKIWNSPEVLKEYLLDNRINLLGAQLKTDLVYANKMKEILCEYLDEAKRVLNLD